MDRGWYACMNALTYRVLTTVKVRLSYFRKDTVMASLDRASEFHFDESETPTKCVVKCCHFPFVFRIKSKIIGHETHGAGTQIFLCTQLQNKSYQLTIYISFFFFVSSFWYFVPAKRKKKCVHKNANMYVVEHYAGLRWKKKFRMNYPQNKIICRQFVQTITERMLKICEFLPPYIIVRLPFYDLPFWGLLLVFVHQHKSTNEIHIHSLSVTAKTDSKSPKTLKYLEIVVKTILNRWNKAQSLHMHEYL